MINKKENWKDLQLSFDRNNLFEDIELENQKQVKKWGVQIHSIFEWLAYTTEELGELSKAISEYVYRNGSADEIYKEALQTATLSLKIAEMVHARLIDEIAEVDDGQY